MKTQSVFLALLFAISSISFVAAQNNTSIQKDMLQVWGNCGMCKSTIEKAALSAGATEANWDTETKKLQVVYNNTKSASSKIQRAIAASGYDTQDFTAPDEAYKKLHSCCQYTRKETGATDQLTTKAATVPYR